MRLYKKNRKLFKRLFLLLIPVLLYGLLKLTLWYSTKTSIDNFSQQYASFIAINYKDISSSIKGSVSINNVTLFIPAAKETIHIKSIRLSADNLFALLKLKYQTATNDIPERLALFISGIKIDLDSQLLKQSGKTEQTPLEQFSTLACGEVQRFDEKSLKSMGYTEIIADFDLSYHYNPFTKTLQLNVNEFIDGFFSLSLSAQIKDIRQIPSTGNMAMVMADPSQLPRLGELKVSFEDDSFVTRKINFCAKNNNSNAKQYVEKHVAMADKFFQKIGIKLHQSLWEAYQKSLLFPGNVILSMDFSAVDNLMALSEFSVNDIISQLNTQLLVNNTEISPLEIQVNKQQLLGNFGANKQQPIIIEDPNVKAKIKRKYQLVDKNKLAQYDQHLVIIKTARGKTYSGQLSIKNSFEYEITSRVHGGNIGYFVKKAEIKSVQVYF